MDIFRKAFLLAEKRKVGVRTRACENFWLSQSNYICMHVHIRQGKVGIGASATHKNIQTLCLAHMLPVFGCALSLSP